METVGGYLKKQRELRNLPLNVISQSTKIQCRYLKAIEEDQYDQLPPRFYTRSYIALYAKCLGIDPVEAIQRYQQIQDPPTVIPPEVTEPPKTPRRSLKPWVFSLPVFGMIVFVLFSTSFTSQTPYERRYSTESLQPVRSSLSFQEGTESSVPLEITRSEAGTPAPLEITGSEAGNPVPGQITGCEMSEARNKLPENAAPEVEAGLQVLTARVGKGINAEEAGPKLIGESSEFGADHQKVYFYTRVQTQREGKIAHVWILEEKEIQRIEIDVKPPTWSTYSCVTVRPHQSGNWKVEARDGDTVLSTQTFKVIEPDSVT
jgi:cytoskeletal protein RodZ